MFQTWNGWLGRRNRKTTFCPNLFGVSELVLVEVVRDAGVEGLQSQKVFHHPDDRGPFAVGDAVEDLVDGVRMTHGNRNGVRRLERVCMKKKMTADCAFLQRLRLFLCAP